MPSTGRAPNSLVVSTHDDVSSYACSVAAPCAQSRVCTRLGSLAVVHQFALSISDWHVDLLSPFHGGALICAHLLVAAHRFTHPFSRPRPLVRTSSLVGALRPLIRPRAAACQAEPSPAVAFCACALLHRTPRVPIPRFLQQ